MSVICLDMPLRHTHDLLLDKRSVAGKVRSPGLRHPRLDLVLPNLFLEDVVLLKRVPSFGLNLLGSLLVLRSEVHVGGG